MNRTHLDNDLIQQIKQYWNPSLKRTACLVQRFDGVWHFGVALSDTCAISWGPSKALQLYHTGCLVIHNLGNEFRDVPQVPYLTKDEIFENIIASVPAFHNKWKYGIQGWNCEHWARLVVSNQAISYQVRDNFLGIFDAFGVLSFRGEAIEQLNKYKFKGEM